MSSVLIKARSQLANVSTFLKLGKPLPAVAEFCAALAVVIQNPLMKAEKEEFTRLIEDAVFKLATDKALMESYPIRLDFVPGEEKQLYDTLKMLLQELKNTAVDAAKGALGDMESKRASMLAQAQELLEKGEVDAAREILSRLAREIPDDSDLKATIADMFIRFGLYEDAYSYLDQAIDASPDQIHLYNRIAIVLRKLGKFDMAEKYFMRAVQFAKYDYNLYFNLGRVYVDWGKWDKAEKAAKMSLKLNEDFAEARKMLNYAIKKQGKTSTKAS